MTARLALAALLVGSRAWAGGFAVPTQSAAALGTANSFSARKGDFGAAFYNPAAAAGQQGLRVYTGAMSAASAVRILDLGDGSVTRNVTELKAAPHLLASYGFNEKWGGTLFVGGGFGASLRYPENWRGRFEVVSLDMAVISVNPHLTYVVHERFQVAAGLQLFGGQFGITSALDLAQGEARLQVGGRGATLAPSASLLFQHRKNLHLAFTARGGGKITFAGDAKFLGVPTALEPRLYDQQVQIALPLPARLTSSVHWQAKDWLALACEMEFHNWRAFERIQITFDDTRLNRDSVRNFNDTLAIRLGSEWKLPKGFTLRGGFAYDPRLAPDTAVSYVSPDTDRFGTSVGVGFAYQQYQFDAAYMINLSPPRKGEAGYYGPAMYQATLHLLAVGAGAQF